MSAHVRRNGTWYLIALALVVGCALLPMADTQAGVNIWPGSSSTSSGSGGGVSGVLVSGRVPYANGTASVTTDADFLFATDRVTATKLGTTAIGAANAVDLGETAGQITFEGSADGFESRLGVTDPTTADQTFLLPNATAGGSLPILVGGAPGINQSVSTTFSILAPGYLCFVSATYPCLMNATAQTPDAPAFATATTSRSLLVLAQGTEAADYAHAQQTNPTVFIHSVTAAGTATDQWLSLAHNQTQPVLGSGKGPFSIGAGSAVASAATITPTGNVFHVTGTTNVTDMTITAAGTCVTLIFDGVLTFTDGNLLKLAGNFTTSADDTISLCSDGTNYHETARSAN